jgi:hypothetical protein
MVLSGAAALVQHTAALGLVEGELSGDRLPALIGALYRGKRACGKKANTAITIAARWTCRIPFQLLKERRDSKPHRNGADVPSRGRFGDRLTAASTAVRP